MKHILILYLHIAIIIDNIHKKIITYAVDNILSKNQKACYLEVLFNNKSKQYNEAQWNLYQKEII